MAQQRLERTQNPIKIMRDHDPLSPGLLQRLAHPPRKIVILRASRIGDFINTMPAFRAIKAYLPESRLTVITLPMLFDLAERCPDIDQVEAFPGYPGMADQLFDSRQALAFFSRMQDEKFDLAMQMQGSGVYSNPFVLMLGARYTAGYIRPEDEPGRLDAALPLPDTGYEIERMLAMTTFLGAPPVERAPHFIRKQADDAAAKALLAGSQPPWIGLHPAARDLTRRWPLERFVEVVRQLQEQHGGTVIILGEKRDRDRMTEVFQQNNFRYLNLAGHTSLGSLIGVIGRLSILITNDTGPAHIAYGLGTPAVVIFGAGDPTRNGPVSPGPFKIMAYPVPCRPCEYVHCPIGYVCLENIHIDEVVNASEKLLKAIPNPTA
jgi:ADP-heptose:LPS heptosyltransferase